jgi:transketolase
MSAATNDPPPPPTIDFLKTKALELRRNMLIQAAGKGQGYLGQGFDIADFLAALYFHELRYDPCNPEWELRDRFYLSTGHYSIALWAVLAEARYFSKEKLPSYGADGSPLEMSTIENRLPGVEMTGGSLGHGLGIAVGAALGYRISGHHGRIFCQISDGELQEGSTWEAATAGSSFGLDNLVAAVDCNGIQADGPMVVNVEPVGDKWRAFGWDTMEIDGNNMEQIVASLYWARGKRGKPKVIVMRTTPGKGVARLEARTKAHFIAVGATEWDTIARELEDENA